MQWTQNFCFRIPHPIGNFLKINARILTYSLVAMFKNHQSIKIASENKQRKSVRHSYFYYLRLFLVFDYQNFKLLLSKKKDFLRFYNRGIFNKNVGKWEGHTEGILAKILHFLEPKRAVWFERNSNVYRPKITKTGGSLLMN